MSILYRRLLKLLTLTASTISFGKEFHSSIKQLTCVYAISSKCVEKIVLFHETSSGKGRQKSLHSCSNLKQSFAVAGLQSQSFRRYVRTAIHDISSTVITKEVDHLPQIRGNVLEKVNSANCKTNKAYFTFQRRLERALLIALLFYMVKIVIDGAWLPPWRNGLAHWTSNSKVVGSSPTGGAFSISLFHFEILKNSISTPCKVKLDFNFAFFW